MTCQNKSTRQTLRVARKKTSILCTPNQNPQTLTIQLRNRNEEIMAQLHIAYITLMKLKLVIPEQHAQREVQLHICQIDTKTIARTATKRNHEALQWNAIGGLGIVEPALRDEGAGRREQSFVVGDFGDGHGL